MPVNTSAYQSIYKELASSNVTLVAVSKTKPASDILELYNLGHRDFGENYVQELTDKAKELPAGIRWHFIGHLQTNKVKLIIPIVQLIHGVDSLKLLREIQKQAAKAAKKVECLLQVHIAMEETKFGLDETELAEIITLSRAGEFSQLVIRGLMGMASFTEDMDKVGAEFRQLKTLFDKYAVDFGKAPVLSMGMSSDYRLAVSMGSNMVRIGSLLFGARSAGTTGH